jgi:2-polyprenyl-3-methyl-5-hydroxy-6-metoxy-1,4-benzoquinol methylase
VGVHLLKTCPICNSDLKELNANYNQCTICNLAISRSAAGTYDETYYYGSTGWDKNLINRSNMLFNIVSKFLKKDDRILDFGCNVGAFVDVCNKNHYRTDGVDVSEKSIEICKQKCKNRGNFYFPGEVNDKYDVVTAFDVIEHFNDLNIFMNEIDNYLNKEGLLIITTPNINSQWIRYFGFGWHGFGIPQYHRYILGKKSLEILAAKHGYSIVNCKEHGILGKNGWKYVLGSEYRLEKNKLFKLLKVPKAFMKYLFLILSKKYYTDTIFIALKRNSK